MSVSAYYPYRSEAVREAFLAHYDSLAADQWPAESEERMAAASYGRTFVRVSGPVAAPPLVLLPGAAATSLMWAPNIVGLSQVCRTFAVDQVSEVGRSTCTRPVQTLDDLLNWLNELLDALGLARRTNLAGMSYGGALTAQFALRYPEKLNKAIMIAPGATVLRLKVEFIVRLSLAAISSRRFLPSFCRWIFADMAREDPKWLDATLEDLLVIMRTLQPRKVPIPPVVSDAEWGRLRVPTLFLVGENETIYDARRAVRRLQRVAPMVKSEVIPGAGHDLTFAQPDLVNRSILAFLQAAPATCKNEG